MPKIWHTLPIKFIVFIIIILPFPTSTRKNHPQLEESNQLFLPIIQSPQKSTHRINVPSFDGNIRFSETAIFWFGQVNLTDNYADVRVGYNAEELYVHVAAFDRRLWYDAEPSPAELTDWDAVSLYLDLDGNSGQSLGSNAYRFDAQLNWSESRDNWQAAYQGDGSDWISASVPFTTKSSWRGNAPNDDIDDRGWRITFHIPFSSLGLEAPSALDEEWGLAVDLYDRDDAAGTPISSKSWPEIMDPNQSASWGQLAFGLPAYSPPGTSSSQTTFIRHGLNGIKVLDAHVGGHTTCGKPYDPDFFNGWGDANYAGYDQINIQNQFDVADWPCFSKFFITFNLDVIPPGKLIISAKLKMYQFGNSYPPEAQPSFIQVLTVKEGWDESAITWNNAPFALENFGGTWVDPVDAFPGYPGIPYEWDVSLAVAEAYKSSEPVRLALYEADAAQHSGKYFSSSDTGDWNAEGRPTLEVVWGDQ